MIQTEFHSDLMVLVAIIIYFFAVFGMLCFFGVEAPDEKEYDSSHLEYDCGLGFDSVE